jgi:hypothetical protein
MSQGVAVSALIEARRTVDSFTYEKHTPGHVVHKRRVDAFVNMADRIAVRHGMTTVQLLKDYTHATGIHRPE